MGDDPYILHVIIAPYFYPHVHNFKYNRIKIFNIDEHVLVKKDKI